MKTEGRGRRSEVRGQKAKAPKERACARCGCTERKACEGGCYWIEVRFSAVAADVARLNLCSACVDKTEIELLLWVENALVSWRTPAVLKVIKLKRLVLRHLKEHTQERTTGRPIP